MHRPGADENPCLPDVSRLRSVTLYFVYFLYFLLSALELQLAPCLVDGDGGTVGEVERA